MDFHPNERDLLFQVPDVYAKFHQNRLKTATVRARTIISAVHYVQLAEIITAARITVQAAGMESLHEDGHRGVLFDLPCLALKLSVDTTKTLC